MESSLVTGQHQRGEIESDKVVELFVPVRRGMMNEMEIFHGETLQFAIDDGRFFFNNIKSFYGQLQYSRVNIDPRKAPLFQINLPSDFPEYCISLRHQEVYFEFVAMRPKGYIAKIFDPCDNSILIGCDSFESSRNAGMNTGGTSPDI